MVDRRAIRLLLGGLVLVLLAPTPAAAEEDTVTETVPIWRNEAVLQKRFAEACTAVETITGVPFAKRPTLELSTRDEVEVILRSELEPQLRATGQEGQLQTSAMLTARMLLAKYEPKTHVIHLVPERFEDESMPLLGDASRIDEDFLRVLLAHEATHAHDWPRFDITKRLAAIQDAEALQAFDAVLEGHAQYVEKRAAALWRIEGAFDTNTEAILYAPEMDEPLLELIVDAMLAQITFSYIKGHAFVEAVAAAKGEEGLVAVMRDPPTSTRAIEHPGEYLDPSSAESTPDLAEALGAFDALVGDEAWTTQKSRVLQGVLEAVRPTIPEAHREAFLTGYQDGYALVGQVPEERRQLIAMLFVFDTPEHASLFAKHERIVQEARDAGGGIVGVAAITSAKYEDGAGRDGEIQGFLAHKVVQAGPLQLHVNTHTFVLGRILGQIMRTNVPEIERRFEDDAIERLAWYLEDPTRSRRTHAFDIGPIALRKKVQKLRVLVVDEDGRPVPRATLVCRTKEGIHRGEVRDGRLVLELPPDVKTIEVLVHGAQDEEGHALNLSPYYRKVVAVRSTLAVLLERGVALTGRVLDPDGNPIAGVVLRARYAGPAGAALELDAGGLFPAAHPPAVRSRADGIYEIVGLSRARLVPSTVGEAYSRDEQWYRLEVEAPEGRHPVAPIPFTVERGAPEVRIRPDDRVAVRILGPDGEPFSDGVLVVTTEGAEGEVSALPPTPGDGASVVLIPRPSRKAKISFKPWPHGRDPRRGPFSPVVEIGPDTTEVTIRLTRGLELGGIVHHEDGTPATGVRVLCYAPFAEGVIEPYFEGTQTDASGWFRFHDVPPGNYHLVLTRETPGDLGVHIARAGTNVTITVTRLELEPAAPK